MKNNLPYIYAILANVIFASSSLVFTVYSKRFSPYWVNYFKCYIAMICFGFTITFTGLVEISLSSIILLLASGAIGLFWGDNLLLYAYTKIGSARTLVLFGFEPLFFGIYGHYFLSQDMNTYHLLAILMMLLCLGSFVIERFQVAKKLELMPFIIALVAIIMNSVGMIMTRVSFEAEPNLGFIQATFLRCLGAFISFFFYYGVKKKNSWLFDVFKSMSNKEKRVSIISSFFGAYLSLVFYIAGLQNAHMALYAAVSITGPLWGSLVEALYLKQSPGKFFYLALSFFLVGFYMLAQT